MGLNQTFYKDRPMSGQQRPYGGYWTQVKLRRVSQYLMRFVDEMKGGSYRTVYVDAFAGSGHVTMPAPTKVRSGFIPASDAQPWIEGSAIQSLKLPALFDRYYFVDRSLYCCCKLNNHIASDFAPLEGRISVEHVDANAFLTNYCRSMNWNKTRAVMFLDSFGPVVKWETLKAIAETRAVDLFYMFPLGIAVTRMLRRTRDDINADSSQTLDGLFGTSGWRTDLFKTVTRHGLIFSDEITRGEKGCEAIVKYFLGRLKTIFANVARNPLKLCNSHGVPMYLLCFASPSRRRTEVAQRIFQMGCPTSGPRLVRLVDCRWPAR